MGRRREFSRKTRQAIIDRASGHCEKCGAVLKPREGEVDHILPCELGGEPTQANGRLLCRPCHKEKTVFDVRRIRESDRQRDKHSGAIRPKQTIPTRPKQTKARPDKLPMLGPRALYQERRS